MDITADHETVVQVFASLARPMMIDYLAGHRAECVACVRITEQVLGSFGVAVKPFPVSMAVSCDQTKTCFLSGFDDDMYRQHGAVRSKEAERIVKAGTGWNGHLVAIADERWLLDPTIDQASYPDKGFVIPTDQGMFCVDTAEFGAPLRSHSVDMQVDLPNDLRVRVQYWPLEDESYRVAPAWELDHIQRAIRGITRAMRQRLVEAA